MDNHLKQLICQKNETFNALVRVEQAIARRERRGAVPKEWHLQREELQAAYDEAAWAFSLYRFFRQVDDLKSEVVMVHDRV